MKALKRVMWTILLGSSLIVGLASTASGQDPYWYDRDWKRHQKEEKRELKRHQKLEREEFGNSAALRRHQKEEQRELKRHQKREKRRVDWPYRY
jgi:hypothetical protein